MFPPALGLVFGHVWLIKAATPPGGVNVLLPSFRTLTGVFDKLMGRAFDHRARGLYSIHRKDGGRLVFALGRAEWGGALLSRWFVGSITRVTVGKEGGQCQSGETSQAQGWGRGKFSVERSVQHG